MDGDGSAKARRGDRVAVAALVASLVLGSLVIGGLVAAAQDGSTSERPMVVVTTEVLGAVVADLAGEAADVTVLMPPGADPHTWQPSARDSETIFAADLLVANGLELEEGLLSVLEQAEANGVPMFRATDHVEVLEVGEADHEAEADHDHGPGDPHFWLDPLSMRDVVLALGPPLAEVGADVDGRSTQVAEELEALHAEVEGILADIPEERRVLVTGHESMGYFADRYGFEMIGTVVPGLTTDAEPSARDVAELIERIREVGAVAVFAEVGTPAAVAQAVADETGATLVEIQDAQLPASGSYPDLIRELATTVAEVLAP